MTLQVKFTSSGERDLRGIRDWIAEHSRRGAVAWLDALEAVVERLKSEAPQCSIASEAEMLGIDLRQRLFKTRRGRVYRLLFVIRDKTVHFVVVRGAGQDIVQPDELDLPE